MAEPRVTSSRDGTNGSRKVSTALFEPVRTRKTFEDVIGQIVDLVASGQLQQGDVLPGERRLAETMDISRPTVRLAVSVLVEAGVLRVSPGRGGGIEIASIWIPDGLRDMAVKPRTDEVFSVLEARRAVEPRIAQLAALRATDEHFDAMQASIDLQRAHSGELHKALQAQNRFHRVMWQAAGNPELERMMVALFRRLDVVMDMIGRLEADEGVALDLHVRTLTALKRGDATDIDHVMDEHLGCLEAIVEEVLGRRRVRTVPDFIKGI